MDGRKGIEHGKMLNEGICLDAYFLEKLPGAQLDAITLLDEALYMIERSKEFDLSEMVTSSYFFETIFLEGDNMGSTTLEIKGSLKGRVDNPRRFRNKSDRLGKAVFTWLQRVRKRQSSQLLVHHSAFSMI